MSDIKSVLICGNYGASNLGDEAILEGMIEFSRKAFPNANITVMSSRPEETEKIHGISSVPLFPSGFRSMLLNLGKRNQRTQKALLQADLFLLGGGGLFTDEKWQAVPIWFIQAWHAFRAKKPVICLGQSVGPLTTFSGRFLAKKVFRKATLITVRDQNSYQQLRQLGISGAKVLADPAFLLHAKLQPKKEPKPYVVFSVRPWLLNKARNQHQILAAMIDWLYEKHHLSSYLYPFQNFSDDDQMVLADILAKVKYREAARLFDYSADFQNALDIIGQARAVVGMRLHSLIFATLETTPFIALSYSTKVSGLVKDLDMSDYCLDWENLKLAELQKKFLAVIEQHEAITQNLTEKRKDFYELALQHVDLLKSMCKL